MRESWLWGNGLSESFHALLNERLLGRNHRLWAAPCVAYIPLGHLALLAVGTFRAWDMITLILTGTITAPVTATLTLGRTIKPASAGWRC